MTDLCPERDGLGHWWLCPTPDGQRVVAAQCRECGATKEMAVGQEYRTGRFYGRKYRQPDTVLDGSSLWAESRK